MAPKGSYELVFGHGHRIEKDLTDEVALAALSAELVADEQIRIGTVDSSELANAINALLQKVNTIMTDITALQAAVTQVQSVDGAAVAELQTLANQVAGLEVGNISQSDIDTLTANLTSVATSVANATTAAQTEVTPPATPVDTPPATTEAAPATPTDGVAVQG